MRKRLPQFLLTLLTLFLACNVEADAFAKKRVFIEQYTSAHCGTCVDGIDAIKGLLLTYPDEIVSVKFHLADTMQINDYRKISDRLNPNVRPTASIDRKEYNPAAGTIAPERYYEWSSLIKKALNDTPIAEITARCTFIGSDSVKLKITIKFDALPHKEMALNYYLIENDVTGDSAFDQENSFNDLSEHPYYKKGNPIKGFVHQNVIRFIGGDIRGVKGSLPPASEIEVGKHYNFTVAIPLDDDWRPSRLAACALIQYDDSLDIRVDNAVYADFDMSGEDKTQFSNSLTIFPNPAYDKATARINLQEGSKGKLILLNSIGETINGYEYDIRESDSEITFDTSHLSSGAYFLRLETNGGTTFESLNIAK